MNKEEIHNFIDRAIISVHGGNGGSGCMSFRREKYIPKGGPDGGDGGRGGAVYFEATPALKTLLDFSRRPKYAAPRGEDGRGKKQYGRSGDDLVLLVPCGTTLYEDGRLLVDLVQPGDAYLAAKGGRGGRGNVHFKSSVRQAPRIAEKGEPGEIRKIELRLKVIADVGLVGMPNAGKSTLLSRLTRAVPKIADYPFTTLSPNLGVARFFDQEIVLADIPGLIEGSHTGKGLGHQFLQHVERTRILVHVVDPFGFKGKTAKESIKTIRQELKKYAPTLAKKPEILAVNKQDMTGAEKIFKEIKRSQKGKKVFPISGVSGAGLKELSAAILKALKTAASVTFEPEPQPSRVELEPDFRVVMEEEGVYRVTGKKPELLVTMTNFALPEAVKRTQRILRKMGIERSLTIKGARPGDPVRIGKIEFQFEPEREPDGSAMVEERISGSK